MATSLAQRFGHAWRWFIVVLFVVVLLAYELSLFYGICYARGDSFFVLSDGCIAFPWFHGQPPEWGDWGWWIQSAWRDQEGMGVDFLPMMGSTRQIGGVGLHAPLLPILLILASIVLPEQAKRLPVTIFFLIGLYSFSAIILAIRTCSADDACMSRVWLSIGLLMFIAWIPVCDEWIRLWLAERRTQPGHCPVCEYNLTGNVSGRCPECGTVIVVS